MLQFWAKLEEGGCKDDGGKAENIIVAPSTSDNEFDLKWDDI